MRIGIALIATTACERSVNGGTGLSQRGASLLIALPIIVPWLFFIRRAAAGANHPSGTSRRYSPRDSGRRCAAAQPGAFAYVCAQIVCQLQKHNDRAA